MKLTAMFITGAIALAATQAVFADDTAAPTAFTLMKTGDQYVGVQSKGKVVQIYSEKSVGTLTPNIWYVVYYDPDATLKAVQVKFGGGQEMEVTHPGRFLEMASDDHKPFDMTLLKIDSDHALQIAQSQPVLQNIVLTSSKLSLAHGEMGPVWEVHFWASHNKNVNDNVDIGTITISANDGSIVKNDLHPNSLN
ncbi:MAG TPA: hypothetical protein VGN23_02545 [Verrucomicrobiae bacterium]|jgi:hypothetical protein